MSIKISLLEGAGFKEHEFKTFTSAMARKLVENRHKGDSWRRDNLKQLELRVCEELAEYLVKREPDELLDVANFCLMIYLRKQEESKTMSNSSNGKATSTNTAANPYLKKK